jgi:hypothetical protein
VLKLPADDDDDDDMMTFFSSVQFYLVVNMLAIQEQIEISNLSGLKVVGVHCCGLVGPDWMQLLYVVHMYSQADYMQLQLLAESHRETLPYEDFYCR